MAARALAEAGLSSVPDGDSGKAEGLSPVTLLDDPETWYATLTRALAEADARREDGPSPVSPASRLVDRCRQLES